MEICDLKAKLNNDIQGIAEYLLGSDLKREKNKLLVGNVHGDKGNSMNIELSGPKAGLWHDFASGEGGDLIDLWRENRGLTMVETLKEIK